MKTFFNQKDFQEQNIFCMNEKRISGKSNLKEHSFNSYVDFQIKKREEYSVVKKRETC